MTIRPGITIIDERDGDAAAIRDVTIRAFAEMPYSSGTEAAIVDALRKARALAVSLVAVEGGAVVGHIAFSRVTIDGKADDDWYGLGPVSVTPSRQRAGVGSALVREGIARLKALGAGGCVLAGDPVYYGRFGFRANPRLTYPDLPAQYFQALALVGEVPKGVVAYHPAFDAKDA